MIYRKNIYAWEQMLRIVAGGGMAIASPFARLGTTAMLIMAASGIGLALTGVFGYCPACALVGRKPVGKG